MTAAESLSLLPLGSRIASRGIPTEYSGEESIVTDPYIPKTLQELDSGEGSWSKVLSTQVATSLQIPFLPIQVKGQQSVFIQEYSKYRDVTQRTGKVRYGIAIRWIISMTQLDAKAKLDQANLIAASVEFGYARATAKFEVIGMQSREIGKLIPAPDTLTVDQYALFAQRLAMIKELVWEPATIITPQLLAASETLIADLTK